MEIREIELDKIETLENIRTRVKETDLSELMNSIKQQGLLQPIGVQDIGNSYVLIWGYRRYLAHKKLGYKKIDAVILKGENMTEEDFLIINATENLHRKNVNVIEFGRVCYLLNKNLSISEIASRLSVSASRITSALQSFKKVPEAYRGDIAFFDVGGRKKKQGKIPAMIANQIIRMNLNKDEQDSIYNWVKKEDISSKKILLLSDLLKSGMPLKRALKEIDNWKPYEIHLAVNKRKFEEMNVHKGDFKEFIKNTLNNEVRGLIY